MNKFVFHSLAAFCAAFLILCATVTISHSQPPPPSPCSSCLIATIDTNACLCQPSACPNCHTFALINNCDSCIYNIYIASKSMNGFTACCATVENPSYTQWKSKTIYPGLVEFSDTSTTDPMCLPGIDQDPNQLDRTLQVTLCGVDTGDVINIGWDIADPPCIADQQDHIVTIPY